MTQNAPESVDGVPTSTQKIENYLGERYLNDYRQFMQNFINWMLSMGKDTQQVNGYSEHTTELTVYKVTKFQLWVWNNPADGYTLQFTPDHADQYMYELAKSSDFKDSYKSNIQKSVKRFYKFLEHRRGGENWEPEFNFTDQAGTHAPRDYLTKKERAQFREAALRYKTIPSYPNLTTEEREKWKAHLAQRFEKSKDKVTQKDFEKANTYKYASLVAVSLDAGLRPVEVERAKTSWIDLENAVLRIPKEESSKNEDNWIVALSERTVPILEKWLEERDQYEKYEDSEKIWLTRYGNPYNKDSLSYLAKRIADEAGIEYENRTMTWYTIRHSVGTAMSEEAGLAATQQQMRHKDERTTMRYDQAPVDERKDALDKMG